MKNMLWLTPLSVLSLLVGCGGGDPLTRTEASYDRAVQNGCRACGATADATAMCLANAEESNPFTGPQWDCQRAAYDRYPNELSPFYDCQADVMVRYESCLRTALMTCPPSGDEISACSDAIGPGVEACGMPTDSAALAAVSACFSEG